MLRNILAILFIYSFLSGCNQNYNYSEKFIELCDQGKLLESKELLDKWEKAEPNNPEMLIGLFNFYHVKSKSKIGDPNFLSGYLVTGEELEETSKLIHESDSLFQISQEYLNTAISKNPDRLDMYIGKSNTLNQKGVKGDFYKSVKSLAERNNENKGEWLWTNGQPTTKSEEEFVGMLQNYIYDMLSSNDPDYKEIISISETSLKMYPENFILLSNIGICFLQQHKFKESISYLEKGLTSNPKDLIIRFNLADAHTQLKQISKAKKYYEYIIKHGDAEYKEMAKEFLEKL